jgi:hypothetical protein
MLTNTRITAAQYIKPKSTTTRSVTVTADAPNSTINDITPQSVDSPLFQETWTFRPWGIGIGATNLLKDDFNGDGYPEIVAGASSGGYGFGPNQYWYVAGHDSTTNTYKQLFVSPVLDSNISRIIIADPDHSGKKVFVTTTGGKLYAYGGWPLKLLSTTAIPSNITAMAAGDVDDDGIDEIILSNGSFYYGSSGDIYILDGTSYTQKKMLSGVGSSDIAVGQLDDDPQMEIVTAGTPGRVIDGLSGTEQWNYASGFGNHVVIGNLDDDSQNEIIGAASWYKITAYDPTVKSPLWEISSSLDISTVTLNDVNNDGIPELIYGDGQWGSVWIIDIKTRETIAKINNPEHGVTGITVGDFDADGSMEVAWGAGYTSSGKDILAVADISSQTIEWQSQDLVGPFSQVDVGDVDNDGKQELVFVPSQSDSGYGGGIIYVLDATSHKEKWHSAALADGFTWTGIHKLKLANLDNDPQLEIIVGTDHLYDGIVIVFDGLTHELQFQTDYTQYRNAAVRSLEVADLDNDGTKEIVAGVGPYIVAFSGQTGSELWKSVTLSNSYSATYDVKAGNVDSDPQPEIIATVDGKIYQFDGVSKLQEWQGGDNTPINYVGRPVSLFDTDGDGKFEILWASSSTQIKILNGDTHETLDQVNIPDNLLALTGAITTDNKRIIIATTPTAIFAFDATTGAPWGKRYIPGGNLGLGNHLPFISDATDGHLILWVGNQAGVSELSLQLYDGVDLALTASPTAQPKEGQEFVQDFSMSNTSPHTAKDIQFTVNLPAEITLTGGTGIDSCTVDSHHLHCSLGSLDPGAEQSFSLNLRPEQGGSLKGGASVSTSTSDVDNSNNTVSLLYSVMAAPKANDAEFSTNEDIDLIESVTGAVESGHGKYFYLYSSPSKGSLYLDWFTGKFTYHPYSNVTGTDKFSFYISDGYSYSKPATVTITINNTDNDPPIANNDYLGTPEDNPIGLASILDNDADPDGTNIQLTKIGTVLHGSIVKNDDGQYIYTPSENYFGPDEFDYWISDGVNTVQGHAAIYVWSVNDAPVAQNDSAETTVNTATGIYNIFVNDNDVENDNFYVVSHTQPKHGLAAFSGNGVFGYMPNPGFVGTDSFEYTISDIYGAQASATITIEIKAGGAILNHPPEAKNDSYSTNSGSTLTLSDLLANDTDEDNDVLSITGVEQPASGTATINSNGSIIYTANKDFVGTDTFKYYVSDDKGSVSWAMVSISVLASEKPLVSPEDKGDTPKESANNGDSGGGGALDWSIGVMLLIAAIGYRRRHRIQS